MSAGAAAGRGHAAGAGEQPGHRAGAAHLRLCAAEDAGRHQDHGLRRAHQPRCVISHPPRTVALDTVVFIVPSLAAVPVHTRDHRQVSALRQCKGRWRFGPLEATIKTPDEAVSVAEAFELAGVDYMTVSPSVLRSLQASSTMQGYNDGLSGEPSPARLSPHPVTEQQCLRMCHGRCTVLPKAGHVAECLCLLPRAREPLLQGWH